MLEWLFNKLGSRYILAMTLITRVVGAFGGALVLYYVNLSTHLAPEMRRHFDLAGAVLVALAVLSTILLALWETPGLRKALWRLRRGQPLPDDLARQAGREAVTFASRNQLHQAILVPMLTVVPMCIYLRWRFDVQPYVMVQIAIATFLAICGVLLTTYFLAERWMAPVTRYLLDQGVAIRFDELPQSRLQRRMNVSFGLITIVTALMIGALANQRAKDLISQPAGQAATVANLQKHVVYISIAAVLLGLALSTFLARSIASRVAAMVEAMKRVEQGCFTERVQPTGNDEIDVLARQFNAMVEQLASNDQTIRDLNVNLESKVARRTRQLSKSRRTLKRSLAKLQEYDRLKTEFFSNISHELRTPLTMIVTPIERLLDKQRAALPPQVVSMLEMVRSNGHRLLELINKLLDFSKLEAGGMRLKLTGLDANRMLEELAAAARPLAEQRGIRLALSVDPALPSFAADQEKLDIILSNLLSNAIKFTPPGGSVEVETLCADDRAWISVSDSGIGISEDDYKRIFERFVQVDGSSSREFSGTGLGLALTKELIELHGGQIYVKSEIGKGTRFWFDLPLAKVPETGPAASAESDGLLTPARRTRFADLESEQPSKPPHEPASLEASQRRDGATILVVDDTPDMRALLGDILSDEYQVVFACDGAEGMEATLSRRPDLIISDVMMPRVDGQEFCRQVRANPATVSTPFVLLTARAELALKIDGLNCGADDYLTKPFEEKELKARVRSLLKLRRLHQDLDKRNRELETAYRDLAAMQGQLIHAEKMSSLGQLVAGLAHEINNSINAVYNGIKPMALNTHRLQGLLAPLLAGQDLPSDPKTRDELENLFRRLFSLANVIENGATRTARIIADLKTFSHPGKAEFEDFDLHESLDMCLNLLFGQIKHRIRVHKEYGAVDRVHGPHGHLNQVFMNILNNAQQAMEGDGEITISTWQQDGEVCVSVRDTGPGIPEEIRSRIFDPFFTTKEPGQGTGLGLSVSYGIVRNLGGALECRSSEGEGAEFIVKFPCRSESQELQTQGDDESPSPLSFAASGWAS
ncbi:MAG TPA: ATP-binding protein [Pirellulales bacterium]|nr:ATP-binding protein [Pirellulales bacterium]